MDVSFHYLLEVCKGTGNLWNKAPLLLELLFWGVLKNRKEYLRHPILPPHPKAGEEFLENSSLSPLVSSMHGNTSVSFAGM
jgi:hypothetical protein